MTDNEIIKALECCSDTANKSCKEKKCPAIKECMTDVDILEKSALYLINRLKGERDCYRNELKYANIEKEALNKLCGEYKAEIERLEFDNVHWNDWEVKCRAINEFAERLKAQYVDYDNNVGAVGKITLYKDIDRIAKELTESK